MIESDRHMLTVMAYGDLNPHRVGKVPHPRKNDWSSYRYYAYGASDFLITPAPSNLALGSNPQERQREYRAIVRSLWNIESSSTSHTPILSAIRAGYSKSIVSCVQGWGERFRKLDSSTSRPAPAATQRIIVTDIKAIVSTALLASDQGNRFSAWSTNVAQPRKIALSAQYSSTISLYRQPCSA